MKQKSAKRGNVKVMQMCLFGPGICLSRLISSRCCVGGWKPLAAQRCSLPLGSVPQRASDMQADTQGDKETVVVVVVAIVVVDFLRFVNALSFKLLAKRRVH